MTRHSELAKKHEAAGLRMHAHETLDSQKILPHIANQFNKASLRNTLTHNVATDSEETSPPYPLRQHPLSVFYELGQANQHQDQGLKYKGEMKAYPAAASAANHEGWTPWSPEDEFAHHYELNHDPRCFARRHSDGETLLRLRHEPSAANLQAYYGPDPASLASHHDPQYMSGSGFAVDMPLRKVQRQQSTLNKISCEKPTPPERNPKRLTMARTPPAIAHGDADAIDDMKQHHDLDGSLSAKQPGSVRKSAINIIRLRPHPSRPERTSSLAQAHIRPSPLGSHPAAVDETDDFPMPPVPPKSARRLSPIANVKANGKDRPFDVDPIDQHKTNVRRPPKGIQHWFDAYISSDDDDESDDGPDAYMEAPEPQELPAEEVRRPAYVLPERGSSLGVDTSMQTMTSMSEHLGAPCIDNLRSPIESDGSNSIQSSHCRGGRRTLGVSRSLATTDLAQQSVLSMSSSDYSSDDDDYDDNSRLPPIRDSIRDSILDDRNFEVASAASIRVQRLSPPGALNGPRGVGYSWSRSMDDLQSSRSYAPTPLTQIQHAPNPQEPTGGIDVTLRRLNGTSSARHSAKSSTPPASDAAHVVAVTDEEMIVLEIMRKKRAEMQEASFTEILQRKRSEQGRFERKRRGQGSRSSAETSLDAEPSAFETQRQLDDIRKAQVDAGFQIERFLGMSSPTQQPSCATPTNASLAENLMLPATVYSPARAPTRRAASLENRHHSEEDLIEVQRRVEQFIATQGAVPPLNSFRTMRRPSHQALSPARAVEQAMPPVAPLRKIRTGSSGADAHGLQHKVSVIHDSHAGMHRTSPVSAFPSDNSSTQDCTPARLSPNFGAQQSSLHSAAYAERPRTASAPVNRRVNFQRSLPRINTDESLDAQRSTLEDVLEGWRDLGGAGFSSSSGMTSQRVQT